MNDNLKEINLKDQKQILLNILKYIDKICRDNNIKYSLIGGSMIGAIRHKGFIPWDDDIDIILDKYNYSKLINILEKDKNSDFEILLPGKTKNYPVQFAKFVDKRTVVFEYGIPKKLNQYGLFVDIFYYNNMFDDMNKNRIIYNKLTFLRKSLYKTNLKTKGLSLSHKIKRMCKNIYLSVFGYERVLNKILALFDKCPKETTKYVMSNNPGYKFEKEIQYTENILDYENVEFEGFNAMIFKNYDEILKTTFGDYMTLPPEDKRVSHNLKAYWRGKNEDNEK